MAYSPLPSIGSSSSDDDVFPHVDSLDLHKELSKLEKRLDVELQPYKSKKKKKKWGGSALELSVAADDPIVDAPDGVIPPLLDAPSASVRGCTASMQFGRRLCSKLGFVKKIHKIERKMRGRVYSALSEDGHSPEVDPIFDDSPFIYTGKGLNKQYNQCIEVITNRLRRQNNEFKKEVVQLFLTASEEREVTLQADLALDLLQRKIDPQDDLTTTNAQQVSNALDIPDGMDELEPTIVYHYKELDILKKELAEFKETNAQMTQALAKLTTQVKSRMNSLDEDITRLTMPALAELTTRVEGSMDSLDEDMARLTMPDEMLLSSSDM